MRHPPSAVPDPRAITAALCLMTLSAGAPRGAAAQARDTAAVSALWPSVGALLVGAALLDDVARDRLARHDPRLADAARAGRALGRGRYLIPAMAVAYGAGRLARRRSWSDAAAHVAAAYVVGNVAISVLKPAVGRHRPGDGRGPWRFRPASTGSDWHSFPSAHTVHAFSIAAALAEEARRPWVSAVGYGAAGLVAWSRLYDEQHWTSDVVAGGILGVAAGKSAVRLLHGRRAAGPADSEPRLRLLLLPTGTVVSLSTR